MEEWKGCNWQMEKRRLGFTLIELLVVIAIIAVLAAILFPVFAKAKENAKRTACVGNLKQLGTAFRLYMDDFGRYPGRSSYPTGSTPPADSIHGSWIAMVYRYGRNARIFQCPCAIQQWDISVLNPWTGKNQTYRTSYSYNEYLFYQGTPVPLYLFYNDGLVRNTHSTAMVADGYQHALFHDWNDTGAWPDMDGCPSGMNRIRYADGPKIVGGKANWSIKLLRHMGPNLVFCDMHVQQVDKEKFRAANYPGYNNPNTCQEYPVVYPGATRF